MSLQTLLDTLPQQGEVVWIGLRPERKAPMQSVNKVTVSPEQGLLGDRYQGKSGKRHVTLLQAEHLDVIASCAGLKEVEPELLRRNILVRGINLLALRNKIIHVGDATLEVTGLCHPCSRMEEVLGEGGYNAMRGHGGITAKVLEEGCISIGDAVKFAATGS